LTPNQYFSPSPFPLNLLKKVMGSFTNKLYGATVLLIVRLVFKKFVNGCKSTRVTRKQMIFYCELAKIIRYYLVWHYI